MKSDDGNTTNAPEAAPSNTPCYLHLLGTITYCLVQPQGHRWYCRHRFSCSFLSRISSLSNVSSKPPMALSVPSLGCTS